VSADLPFERVKRAIGSGASSLSDSNATFSDALRLAARLRRLEERLGRGGVAELSPYLESLLRMAQVSKVVETTQLRQAAGF
jgi:hypothetical protein